MRLSAHNLSVESGRYSNIPRQKRVCNLCNLDEVGDEFHYYMRGVSPSPVFET